MIKDARLKILEAWQAVEEEAADQETKPVLRIGFAIVLDLQTEKMETVLSFGVRHKLNVVRDIPDPNQIDLELNKETEVA